MSLSLIQDIKNLQPKDHELYFYKTYLRATSSEMKEFQFPQWGFVDGLEADLNGRAVWQFRVSTHKVWTLPTTCISAIQFFPQEGMYNYKASVLHIGRSTCRQYKKGFCADSSSIVSLMDQYKTIPKFPKIFSASNFNWKWENIFQLLNSPLSPWERALVDIKNGRALARAVTRDVTIGLGIQNKHPSCWINLFYLGYIPNKNTVIVRDNKFSQEAKDFLAPLNVHLAVEGP